MKTVNVVDMRRLGRLPAARGAAAISNVDGKADEQPDRQPPDRQSPDRPTVRFLGETERRTAASTGRKAKTRGGRLRRGVVVSAAGVVALVVSIGSVSAAATVTRKAKTSGPEKVFVIPTTTSQKHPGKIVMTGTIADYGTTVTTNAKGTPTKNGTYAKLELKKGTILVDVAALDKALDAAFGRATIDKSSCSISTTVSGAVTIVSGTKAYAGIKGSFTLSGNVAEIASRTKSGACTFKTTTPPLVTFIELTGSGTVSLP